MKCAEYQELIQQHLDGLEPSDPAALEAHLRSCPACQALHAATTRLRAGLRLLTPPAPPPGMACRIATRLQVDYRSRLLWRGTIRVALAVAAAVLAARVRLAPATHDSPATVPRARSQPPGQAAGPAREIGRRTARSARIGCGCRLGDGQRGHAQPPMPRWPRGAHFCRLCPALQCPP